MATKVVPAVKTLVCDICLTEQLEFTATQPMGLFTYRASITMTRTMRLGNELPLKFDACNKCMESVSRVITSMLAVARGQASEPLNWVVVPDPPEPVQVKEEG